jgi:membrane-associated phospholipid phosphatase
MNTDAARRAFSEHRLRVSRRTLIGSGLAATALWMIGTPSVYAGSEIISTNPGAWATWLLDSAADLRPDAPPAPTQDEIDELLDLQARRTDATHDLVLRWATGPAVLPWTEVALGLIKESKPSPVRAARALALLHAAVYDAVVATWDAKAAYPRPAPSVAIPELTPLRGAVPADASFPSEQAAVAGAASTVLAYLFPAAAGEQTGLADEAASSRLWAGTSYRSDVEAGLALGRSVGERAVERGMADGSDAAWTGDRPTDDGAWQPTPPAFVDPPLDPLAGTWRTWILASGDALRPAPPAPYGSPGWQAELDAVRDAVARRTPDQEAAARFWAGGPGTVTPSGLWTEIARDLITGHGLDLPHAARVLALTTVAMADAFVCCWDAKYAYWTARPITADPGLAVLFPTPPFPSYTSGHSTISAAAATVLGHLFPANEAALAARAEEAKQSRLWAGIHFPIDNDVGAVGGRLVGRLVVGYARTDGAE